MLQMCEIIMLKWTLIAIVYLLAYVCVITILAFTSQFSIIAPAIAVSAAVPNGDGLDRNGNSPSASTRFTVISFNPRKTRETIAIGDVDALVANAGRPSLVAITESWLGKTAGHVTLSRYHSWPGWTSDMASVPTEEELRCFSETDSVNQ